MNLFSSVTQRKNKIRGFLQGIGLYILGIFGMLIGSGISYFIPYPTEYFALLGTVLLSQGIGFLGISFVYIQFTSFTVSDLLLSFENKSVNIKYIGIVVVSLLAANYLVLFASSVFDITIAENVVTELLQSNKANIYMFVLVSFLLIGPLEELFFRGILQQHFARDFSLPIAIIFASFLFAILHIGSLIGNTSSIGYVMYLLMTFVGGIILGYSYEKTESLFVPMIAHGAYNAFLGLTMIF